MAGNITISAANLPEGTCPPWLIPLWPLLVAQLSANLNGALNVFNYGNSVPAPADQGKPWIRLNTDGTFDKLYVFSGGSWISPHPDFTGKVVMWEGDITTVDTLDGGEAGVLTATTGPMWARVTELQAKFPIGVGTLPGGTALAVGSTGGEENHVLTIAELAKHSHVLRCDSKMTVGDGVRRPRDNDAVNNDSDVNTNQTGSDAAHNNMPPYYGLHFLRKSARRFYRV